MVVTHIYIYGSECDILEIWGVKIEAERYRKGVCKGKYRNDRIVLLFIFILFFLKIEIIEELYSNDFEFVLGRIMWRFT